MSPAASGEKDDHGVGSVVKKNEEPPPGGEPQDEQAGEAPPPASTEPSMGDAATGPTEKQEDIVAVGSETDTSPPQPQGLKPTVAGKPEPPAVGECGEVEVEIISPSEAPVVNTPQTNELDAIDHDPAFSSSKDKKPRLSLRIEGVQSDFTEDGKLIAESPTRRSKVTETNFPMKLYDILSNPDNQHAISWMPHGRSWKVRQKELFMRTICPQYFTQSKFESFIRQANGWGFRRIRKEGPDRNSYYHELFLRGKPELMKDMSRPLPGEKASQEVVDPNFYNMPAMPLMPHEIDQPLSKQMTFPSEPGAYGGKKKRPKKESNTVRSSPGSAFSDPYGGCGPYPSDSNWHGMPPPPPSPWGAPYAYSHPSSYYGGYGVPPPPPPSESAAAGWSHQHQPSPSYQGPGTNMPSPPSDTPPFDPAFYFHQYHPPFPPQPPPLQSQTPQVSSQDQADGGANVEPKMNQPPYAQMPPPHFSHQYPPYPPSYPPPYHPPGDMPYPPSAASAEGGPTSVNPDSSASYYYQFQFGSVPPNHSQDHQTPGRSLPSSLPLGHFDFDPNLERNDSFQFSPIQHPDGPDG